MTKAEGSKEIKSFVGEPISIDGGQVFINPGTGPVVAATEQNAIFNMEQFVRDSPCATSFSRNSDADYGNGRFAFEVYYDPVPEQYIRVQMPGLPLEEVRYLGEDGQDAWDFPRLYVDGSSWLWCYALIDCDYWGG